ncbi:hypothetical protein WJX84_001869 [Apatococcus fuscideae]|uniref:Vesicle transport v-SNARE N-terminal domain-containing protein n=1 Tax=Apatococcus fuscideae TaxID=2026836 RepID=A0AAW1RNB1_9CHLO
MSGEVHALFSQYENEYCSKSTELARKTQAIGSLSGEMRRQKQREADSDMKEADQIIKRMEMEARSFSPDKSRSMLAKVREYKADLQRIRTDLQAAGIAAPGSRILAHLPQLQCGALV